ncbi:hypothetical protein Ait01nite_021300 [Actinoplanes italicus]|nr:hypothetical protein Ait01nite_021300 [Actinoplanes italicus]
MVPAWVVGSVASLIALISTLDACAAQRTSARCDRAIPVRAGRITRRLVLGAQNVLPNGAVSVPDRHSGIHFRPTGMATETDSTGVNNWHSRPRPRIVTNC